MKLKLKDTLSKEDSSVEKENWYSKSEPTLQINILKKIALDDFQSKKSLIDTLRKDSSTIDTTVNKMAILHDLIQMITYLQKKPKHKPEILYSLTEKSIKILVKYHYQKTNNPYLNKDEFIKFLKNVYDKQNIPYSDEKNVFPNWIRPNITKEQVMKLYLESNKEYLSQKFTNSKIIRLKNKVKDAGTALSQANEEYLKALYESFSFMMKR